MGAVGYLVKPVDKAQLTCALEKLESEDTTPRILVIDDNPEDLKMMEAILRGEGFEVLLASNGVKGVAEAILYGASEQISIETAPGLSAGGS